MPLISQATIVLNVSALAPSWFVPIYLNVSMGHVHPGLFLLFILFKQKYNFHDKFMQKRSRTHDAFYHESSSSPIKFTE